MGYGKGLITPVRKPPGRELRDDDKEFNSAVNAARSAVERCIADLKTWRILHIDYRRPCTMFETIISAVVDLEFTDPGE